MAKVGFIIRKKISQELKRKLTTILRRLRKMILNTEIHSINLIDESFVSPNVLRFISSYVRGYDLGLSWNGRDDYIPHGPGVRECENKELMHIDIEDNKRWYQGWRDGLQKRLNNT
jgi:hypothetical protein